MSIEKEKPSKVLYGPKISADTWRTLSQLELDDLEDKYGVVDPTIESYSHDRDYMQANEHDKSLEIIEASPEAKTHAIDTLASTFHENWRKTRLTEQGEFEPRTKETEDETWIEAHGTNKVDIANTAYEDLPSDWQAENKAAAEIIVDIIEEANGDIDLSDVEVRSRVGQRVHEAWLSRNGWAEGGELDRPFDELPEKEQSKDIEQIQIGLEIFTPRE